MAGQELITKPDLKEGLNWDGLNKINN